MVAFKRSEIKAIEEAMAFPSSFGYVLDFSDRTMSEFFEDEFGIEIYEEKYLVNGSSKRNCLTTFLKSSDVYTALKVLRALWERREGIIAKNPDHHAITEAINATEAFKKMAPHTNLWVN